MRPRLDQPSAPASNRIPLCATPIAERLIVPAHRFHIRGEIVYELAVTRTSLLLQPDNVSTTPDYGSPHAD
jgi:hypothetical protein